MTKEKNITRIPDAELDIMLILWRYDRAVRIIDIFNDMQLVRPCIKTTIHSLLERLEAHGFVKIDFSDDRRAYKLITPKVSESEYRAAESKSFVNKLCRGKWQTLVAALIDCDEIGEDDIDEINKMLKVKKQKDERK